MDLRQSPLYSKYLTNLGWVVEEKEGVFYFIKKLWFIGSVIKIQRPNKIDFSFIENLSKKYRAFQIILEPSNKSVVSNVAHKNIIRQGFKLAKSSYLPTKTTIIDLRSSHKTLLKNMHHKTRYNIKKALINKLEVRRSNDINIFADFWQNCALKQRGMYISQKREIVKLYGAFKKDSSIIFVYSHPTQSQKQKTYPLAGVFSVFSKDTAFYMYAAATPEGKKLFAPTLAAWKSIKLAKNRGLKYYDFEGIFDERFPLPGWKGFSRFKLSFGGKVVEHIGSFTRYKWPFY